jgi:hypothetical protein
LSVAYHLIYYKSLREKRREEKVGEVVRNTTFGGQEILFLSPVLEVPRQCPLILLVEVYLREGEALGSEKV